MISNNLTEPSSHPAYKQRKLIDTQISILTWLIMLAEKQRYNQQKEFRMLLSYGSQYEAEVIKMKINVLVVQPMKSDKIPKKKRQQKTKTLKKKKTTTKNEKKKTRHQFIKYCT